MQLYHGTNIDKLTTLNPCISNHEKPYVYFTDCFNLAVMYAAKNHINTYWFKDGVLHYDEYFENQFKVLHNEKSGTIYGFDGTLQQLDKMPWVYLSETPVDVCPVLHIDNIYEYLTKLVEQGEIILHSFDSFSDKAKEFHFGQIYNEIINDDLISKPDDSYALFIQKHFPTVWENAVQSRNCASRYMDK